VSLGSSKTPIVTALRAYHVATRTGVPSHSGAAIATMRLLPDMLDAAYNDRDSAGCIVLIAAGLGELRDVSKAAGAGVARERPSRLSTDRRR
jgi:hypothetical protein